MTLDPRVNLDLDALLRLRNDARGLQRNSGHASPVASMGGHRANARGRGIEFEEVRHYQAGDDVRAIDWRVTARSGKAHTKLFREEKERPLLLLVDQRQSMFFASRGQFKSVYAATFAGLQCWQGLLQGDRIGGIVLGQRGMDVIKAARGKRNALRLLGCIADRNSQLANPFTSAPPPSPSLSNALQQLLTLCKPGSHVVILTDAHDLHRADQTLLWQIRQHSRVDLIQVLDPIEQQLPTGGVVGIGNGTDRRRLHLGNHHQRRAVEQQLLQHQQFVAEICRASGCQHSLFSCDSDVTSAMREWLRRPSQRQGRAS
ncbi:MAG TPA: DUF58 domain-containing protein [Pseudomonadales bacterium]|nr:DUF58 domain-containing protein [Pseudomonadales bacterium]